MLLDERGRRPKKRSSDDPNSYELDWPRIAVDSDQWRDLGEAFAQQWNNAG